jgi:hypothetical protein
MYGRWKRLFGGLSIIRLENTSNSPKNSTHRCINKGMVALPAMNARLGQRDRPPPGNTVDGFTAARPR